jgi:uncharacterized protein (DUF362 family)
VSRPTRRQFLQTLSLAGAAAACGRQPYRAADFARPERSAVAILPASRYDLDLEDVVRRGLNLLQVDVRGKRVFLKPNLVEYEADTAINTNPRVVGAAAAALLSAGALEVVVGEGPGHRRDVEYLLQGTGLEDHLRDHQLRFVDLNHDDVREMTLRSNFTGLGSVWLPATLLDADLVVSMPKLKTHHWAGMTASMKNLFGTVPGAVYGWPKNVLHVHGIEQSIVDLTATIRPGLTIVDAIVGMEGDGPIRGRARDLGFLAMGTDLLAVDATCARVIGLDPTKMPYLSVPSAFLGHIAEARIDQRGERLDRYRTRFDVVESIERFRL